MADFSEFISACFSTVNLPFTTLLGVMCLYWITVILGALDIDAFDVDLDSDFHGNMDFDVDLDGEVDGDGDLDVDAGGWLISTLRFFNVGAVPLMILLSFLFIFMWMTSILLNYYLENTSLVIAAILFVPNLFLSLFITKFVTMPIRALFKGLGKNFEIHEDLTGKTCTIITSKADGSFGQAEVMRKGVPLTLNVITAGEEILRGAEAVILHEDKEKGIYRIKILDIN